ncbi:MAG TPA: hypothetical protein VFH47_03325, partial [Candidatus Thermoplasmatota archaeon]|nr:hypothetical protein [Candidatus Thermoplasmatota archaeon]
MRGAAIAVLGALVLAGSALALLEDRARAGPHVVPLQPVPLAAQAAGTFEARAASGVGGLCIQPPCSPSASLELRLVGLPPVGYDARLEGRGEGVMLGRLEHEGGRHTLRWSDARDHTDKLRLVLLVAGAEVAGLPLRGEGTTPLHGTLHVLFPAPPGTARLAEIGGVTVSTTATVRLQGAAPPGYTYHASLDGAAGPTALGELGQQGG